MPTVRFDAVLFDLDGTLTDSGPGITRSAAHALRALGAKPLSEDVLRRFVGPPLLESFMQYGGLTEAEALRAVALYRERYLDVGWKENQVYPGIPELIADLKDRGARVILASSKPEQSCLRVLEYFALLPHFDAVCAIRWDEHHADKAEIVARALAGLPQGARVCMVGDRRYDIEGARANDIFALGVAYGYGSREELETAGADAVADTVADLRAILLDGAPPT